MLQIHHSHVRNVKKYAVYSICLIVFIITLSNIFSFSVLADEADHVASVTETVTQSEEYSTESITSVAPVSIEEATEEATEESSEDDNDLIISDDTRFLLLVITVLLLILIVVIIFGILI